MMASRVTTASVPSMGLLGGLGLSSALYFMDPNGPAVWKCPLAEANIDCPGCGGLRAVHYLTHLDFAQAASSNLFVVLALPFAIVTLILWARNAWLEKPQRVPKMVAMFWLAMLPLLAIFTIARNFPNSWLAP